jgi:Bax protein
MRYLFCIATISIWMMYGCSGEAPKNDVNESNATVNIAPYVEYVADEEAMPKRTVQSSSLKDIYTIFNELGYTHRMWDAQKLIIPRLYLQRISCRWQSQSSQIPVKTKKQIFFQLITPAILRSNELIQMERNTLITLMNEPVDVEDEHYEWLMQLARKYKVLRDDETRALDAADMQELIERVDTVPLSLALAQAAEESGWATSRFARDGNALFGQWTFGKNAMVPKEQRSELGNYGLKRFKTPQESVNSYMLNLNTNHAYKELRHKRAALRRSGQKVSGLFLIDTLHRYSERGDDYVDGLKRMILQNHLAVFDNAKLWEKEVVYLHPKKTLQKSRKLPLLENNVTAKELLKDDEQE